MIKTRLMASREAGDGRRHATILGAASELVRAEGVAALWRGWLPATLSLMPIVAIVFPLMEWLRAAMGVGVF